MKTKISRNGIDWGISKPAASADYEDKEFLFSHKASIRDFLVTLIGVTIPLFVLFRAYFGPTDFRLERTVVTVLILCHLFLVLPIRGQARQERKAWLAYFDWLLFFISLGIGAYVLWGFAVLGEGATVYFTVNVFGHAVQADAVAGILLTLLVLEANRRAMGWSLVIFTLIFLAYIPLRPYIPGPLGGTPFPWKQFAVQLFTEPSGIVGVGPGILLSVVFLFLTFGSLMSESKVGAFFFSLANSFMGNRTGGPAKVAIVSSALVGTVNASAISNVATTGVITIPIMKANGFKPEDAAAIETVASTGGLIMPPVMGAVAFLIAEFLGISYGKLVVYAFPAAIMYFTAVFAAAHWKARKAGLTGLPKEQLPSFTKVIAQGWHLALPLIALVALLIMDYSVGRAAFVAIVGMLVLSFFKKETRMSPLTIISVLSKTTRAAIIVSSTLLLTGLIVGVVQISGIGLTISVIAMKLTGGSLVIGLLLGALIAFVLGLPLPALVVYIYGAIFIIPTLIDLGANPLAAHMFFLYYAFAGGLTPPVCVTAYTAASIAGAPMLKTGWAATKLGYTLYLIPFLFVFNPAILLQNFTWSSVPSLILGFLGIIITTAGIEGYFLRSRSPLERTLLIITGLSLLSGSIWSWGLYAGMGMLIFLVFEQLIRERKRRASVI